ncbi:unnamed protein product [Phaeothamnion confervicola]
MKGFVCAVALAALGRAAANSGHCKGLLSEVKFYANKNDDNMLTSLTAGHDRPMCDEDTKFRLPFTAAETVTSISFNLEFGYGVHGGPKEQGWSYEDYVSGSVGMEAGSAGSTSSVKLSTDFSGPQFTSGSVIKVTVEWEGTLAAGETATIIFKMRTACQEGVCENDEAGDLTNPDSTVLAVFIGATSGGGDITCDGKQKIPAMLMCCGGGGGDPHIWGYSGAGFYFDGLPGNRYAFVHDRDVSINIAVAARYSDGSEPYTDIVSAGIVLRNTAPGVDRKIAVVHAVEACNEGFSAACTLPAHGAVVLLDGKMLPLGMADEGDIQVAVAEMPHFCKIDPDALDRDYAMMDEMTGDAQAGRSLRGAGPAIVAKKAFDFKAWLDTGRILGVPSEANGFVDECEEWLATRDAFAPHMNGELTTVMIRTATVTFRIEHWSFLDADEHLPADGAAVVASVPLMLNIYPQQGWRPSRTAHGLLGQTVRPVMPGQAIMEGDEEDYRVDSLFATNFKFYP